MITETCCSCGVVFGLTDAQHADLKRRKAIFYCPNGHGQSYSRNEADALREQLQIEQRAHGATRTQLESYRSRFAYAESTYRCPVAGCDVHYQQKAALRRHMEREHGYAEKARKALPANAGPDARGAGV